MTALRRARQRGSAMLVTLIIVSALLAGAAVLVSMQLASNRSADLTRTGLSSLFCAEAGLDAARPIVAGNYPGWTGNLGTGTEPAWLSTLNHDIDGDGKPDFVITLKDNDDELPPNVNNPAIDNDLSIFVVSTCINPKYPDTQKQVEELVYFSGGGTCYHSQFGNCNANNNTN
jgi:hypothetical protein